MVSSVECRVLRRRRAEMTSEIRSYRDLIVWQKGMDLVDRIYDDTQALPREEIYGITSQMRRAAVSVPSNIAEGQAKRKGNYFVTHLDTALGSLAEMDTLAEICRRRGLIPGETADQRQSEIFSLQKMVMALQDKITCEC